MAYDMTTLTSLNKTIAWNVTAAAIVAITIVCWLGYNYNYTQVTERRALELGMCQTQNVDSNGRPDMGYHWVKCK